MSEALQKLILDTLESQGTIKDTRSLILPGNDHSAYPSEEQIIILGALNSLLSREVSHTRTALCLALTLLLLDDRL